MEEAKYESTELAKNAKQLFETTPEVATVALRLAGKETATKEEAADIIRAFLSKEVK